MESLLPSLPALLVLSVLADGPAHGYEIASRVRERSGDVLGLKEGTLYPRLYQLEREGEIQGEWRADSGRRVRVYELTDQGRHRLDRELSEWRRRVDAAERVLGSADHVQRQQRRLRLGDI